MSKVTPVFVFNSLDLVRGGLTKAVLLRANTLADHFDEVVFLTLKFQKNHHSILKKMYDTGKLHRKVKVINFFNYMKNYNKNLLTKPNKVNTTVKEKGYIEFKDAGSDLPSYRYYQNGLYKMYKRFNNKGKLLFIDYFDDSRHRLKREEYDNKGTLVRIRNMDRTNNKPRLDQYLDIKGDCFLTVWVDPNTKKEGKTFRFLDKPKEFKALNNCYRNWVEDMLGNFKNPVIISDSRYTDKLVLEVKNKVKKVAVLHNNHFKEPYDETAEINPAWNDLFNDIEHFDRVVFLTEEQKNDVGAKFGYHNNYAVIPHYAKPNETKVDAEKDYNPHLMVTLARYHQQKRLDEAIHAFKYVVEEIPDAQFHIYGFGPKEEELKELISSLELKKNVKLKGFTEDSSYVYKTASCSILTSDFEGFGMVMTESLAAGTPVVAYDIKYGPKDIIRDGIDGFLISKGDKRSLAEKIIKIMKDPELRKELSANSYEVLERYSSKNYERDWVNLFKSLK